MKTLCTAIMILSLFVSAGCNQKTVSSPSPLADEAETPKTLTFREQVEAVRAGTATEIRVDDEAVGDGELSLLDEARGLTRLELNDFRGTATGLQHLAALDVLTSVVLRGEGIDNAALAALAKCSSLLHINLPEASFSDEGLMHLRAFGNLKQLRFHSPNVTDAGMEHIAELSNLRFLHLVRVPITDAGLAHLESMTQLESFYIDDASITDDGLERLLKAIPGLHLHINQQHSDRDPNRHEH